MTKHHSLRLLGAVLALGLLLAACGDDDGADDASTDADATDTGGVYGGGDDDGDDAGGGAACDGDVCLAGIAFAPDAATVAAGDTVTWASVDSPDHTVTADDGSFDSGTISNGDTFDHTFDAAGEFPFHCEIHPSMTGTITVE